MVKQIMCTERVNHTRIWYIYILFVFTGREMSART